MPTYQYRCKECGKSFERTETITEHEAAKVRCPKCNSKKVTQVPGRVHVVTSKKAKLLTWGSPPLGNHRPILAEQVRRCSIPRRCSSRNHEHLRDR